MGIQEVQNQTKAPAYQRKAKAGNAEGFQKSLLENLRYRGQEEQEAEAKQAVTDAQSETKQATEKTGMGRMGVTAGIRVNTSAGREAMQTAEVRHMSYEESDHVRIAVMEGYTLKGKREKGADDRVYVEAKYDDGRLEAYQVETTKVSGQTEHLIERFALETMGEA